MTINSLLAPIAPVDVSVFDLTKLAFSNAGTLALSAFAGVFLGGILLSFFWKNFGPWKLLDECKRECQKCRDERESDGRNWDIILDTQQREHARILAEVSDFKARYEVLSDAVKASGLGLKLG